MSSAHCREGKVFLADSPVKPSSDLKGGEVIRVRKGAVHFEYKVIDFPRNRVAASMVTDFALDVTPESERQKMEEIRAAQKDLIRPVGRPTKRDRRDWEKWFK